MTRSTLRSAIPWIVSLVLMCWVYWSTDIPALLRAMAAADLARFLPLMAGLVGVLWIYDGLCYSRLLTRFASPVSYREAMTLRGASYLLNVINYALANAVIAAFLQKTKGVAFFRGTSAILWMMVIDVYVLAIVATAGTLWFLPDHHSTLLFVDGALALIMTGNLLYWRRGWNFFLLGSLRHREVFAAFAEAKVVDYLTMTTMRIPYVLFFVVANGLLLPCFGIRPPWTAIAAYCPLVSLITALPISIAGLGTYQMAMRQFFGVALGNPIAVVDAFSTMQMFVSMVMRLALGAVVYRRLQAQIAALPTSADRGLEVEFPSAPSKY